MAKQRRVLPARKPQDRSRDNDSLLLRSAESLGRVIGALQRQLDGATRRLSHSTGNGGLSLAKSRTARPSARKSTARKRTIAIASKRKTAKKR
jgi:hypothetical protein